MEGHLDAVVGKRLKGVESCCSAWGGGALLNSAIFWWPCLWLYWGCYRKKSIRMRWCHMLTYDSIELGSRGVWRRAVGWRKSHVEHSVTLDLTVPRVVSDNEDWFDFSLLSYGFGDSPWSSPFEMKGWWWEGAALNVLRGTLGGCTNMWIKVYCICLLQWSCKEELHETFSPCFPPRKIPLDFPLLLHIMFLAPTGALHVTMLHYRSTPTQATFVNFHS